MYQSTAVGARAFHSRMARLAGLLCAVTMFATSPALADPTSEEEAARSAPSATGAAKPAKASKKGRNCDLPQVPRIKLIKILKTGGWPKGVEITRDERLAITSDFSWNSLTIVDTKTLEVIKTVKTGKDSPVEIAYLPDNRRAVISGGWQNSIIFVFDLKKLEIIKRIQGKPLKLLFPKIVQMSPDDKEVWISFWNSDKAGVFDSKTLKLLRTVNTARNPRGIGFTPDGKKVYIAGFCNNCKTGSPITVHIAKTGKRIAEIPKLRSPRHIVPHPNGKYMYASILASGELIKIDVATDKIVKRIRVGKYPKTIAMDKCGRYVFVANYYSDTIMMVDSASMKIVRTIKAGKQPSGLALSHNDSILWTTDWTDNKLRIHKVYWGPVSEDEKKGVVRGIGAVKTPPLPVRKASILKRAG